MRGKQGKQMKKICFGCKRKFNGNAKLQKHLKTCVEVQKFKNNSSGIRQCILPGDEENTLNNVCVKVKETKSMFGPKMRVCYICGEEYGSKSIKIHEKSCAERFKQQQKLLPAKARKNLPTRPPFERATSLLERNSWARESFENLVMETCPGCERTFCGKDKLEKHMKGCDHVKRLNRSSSRIRECMIPEGYTSHNDLMDVYCNMNVKDVEKIKAPKTYVCYICGRNYGSNSIDRHELHCLDMFLKQQEKLPKEEQKPPPRRPLIREGSSRLERNSITLQAYQNEVMEECKACGRKFDSKTKLEKHMKGCNAAKKLKRRDSGFRDCIIPGWFSENEVSCIICDDGKDIFTAPKMRTCYICGEGFGSKSISIHEKKCAELFKKKQEILPPEERKELPNRPPLERANSLMERNSWAQASFENMMMETCPGCERTFHGKEKLEKHMKGCDWVKKMKRPTSGIRDCIVPGGSFSHLDLLSLNGFCDDEKKSPRTCVCYICGREYGSNSISIHEKQCAELFKKRQELLPPEERKDLPERPPLEKASSLKERNSWARASFEDMVMETCPGCERTFDGKAKLLKHMKGCDNVKKMKQYSSGIRDCLIPKGYTSHNNLMDIYCGKEGDKIRAPKTYVCYICGRQYGSKSIGIHEEKCMELFLKQQQCLPTPEKKSAPVRPLIREGSTRLERNSIALQAYQNEVMEECKGCGRKFDSKIKLEKHMKGCDAAKQLKSNYLKEEKMMKRKNLGDMFAANMSTRTCYICGEQHRSRSHTKRCKEVFKQKQALLPINERKSLPEPPPFEKANSLQERNLMARETFERFVAEKCHGCDRIFDSKDKLLKHMKGCDLVRLESTEPIETTKNETNIGPLQCLFTKGGLLNDNNLIARSLSNFVMVSCKGCDRTFDGDEKLEKHMKGCDSMKQIELEKENKIESEMRYNISKNDNSTPKSPKSPKRSNRTKGKRKKRKRIKTPRKNKNSPQRKSSLKMSPLRISPLKKRSKNKVSKKCTCYVCGLEFGEKAISFHEEKCLEKFKSQQKALPIQDRKEIPTRPAFENAKSLVERNVMAKDAFENTVLERCVGCHRAFNSKDKLLKHMKGCTQAKDFKLVKQ